MPNSLSKIEDESTSKNISLSARLLELEAESRKVYDKSHRQGSHKKDSHLHPTAKRFGRKNAPSTSREYESRENKLWEKRVLSPTQSIGKNYDLSQPQKVTTILSRTLSSSTTPTVEAYDIRSRVPHYIREAFRKNAEVEILRLLLKAPDANSQSLLQPTTAAFELELYDKSPTSQIYHNLASTALLKLRNASSLLECGIVCKNDLLSTISHTDTQDKAHQDICLPYDSFDATYECCLNIVLTVAMLEECDYPTFNQQVPENDHVIKKNRTEKDIQEIQRRQSVKASGQRVCDRCNEAFFPNYSHSADFVCCFHPGKLQSQQLSITNGEERVLVNSCCLELRNTPGCQKRYYHVYRLKGYLEILNEEREMNEKDDRLNHKELLYAYTPLTSFEKSTSREKLDHQFALSRDHPSRKMLALDCEMCYTTGGLEVTRVSLVDMYGRRLLDELVKPENPIIDDNVEFSGVTEKMIQQYAKYNLSQLQKKLLSEYLFEDTILVGHSLESDLKALRIIHHRVIDTSILYMHPWGLPYRFSLKTLAQRHLQKLIQGPSISAGVKSEQNSAVSRLGHDSYEDARIALELVYFKVKRIALKK